tara:strand:+ start:802 stop:1023 length:222 start_codon:yes stop_codon:yes gene_type:complete
MNESELISRCGYCGDVIDFCQGHGEDERAKYGFDYDSDEYEARREAFEQEDHHDSDGDYFLADPNGGGTWIKP